MSLFLKLGIAVDIRMFLTDGYVIFGGFLKVPLLQQSNNECILLILIVFLHLTKHVISIL